VLRRWRRLASASEPERILVGETYVFELDQLIPFYGSGTDELHLAFNFLFIHSRFDAGDLRTLVESMERRLPRGAWPVYTGSNHDGGRLATRWADGDDAKVRCALTMLLTLRGTPFLYYGDEIGMPEVPIDPARSLDPVPHRTGEPTSGRDGCRTPMQWRPGPGAGFTDGDRTWLPIGDAAARNVAAQRDDPGSILHLARDLIALRRERADLRSGGYATLPAPEGAWAWRRGESTAGALNLSDAAVAVDGVDGEVLIATDRARDGSRVAGALELAPWSGAVVALSG
jgi:alpha-glucosidase